MNLLPSFYRIKLLKRLDNKWHQGNFLNVVDEGPVSPGSKTRRFAVNARLSGKLLGYVKWYAFWRMYCFFPTSLDVLHPNAMDEIVWFVREQTKEHRAGK